MPKMKRQDRIVRKMKAVLDEKGHLEGSVEEVFTDVTPSRLEGVSVETITKGCETRSPLGCAAP